MMFNKPPLLTTDACLEFVNALDYGKTHPVHELVDCATAACIWGCLNEIYPAWFDDSLKPSNFASQEEALQQNLYYLDEFHENRYAGDFKIITTNIKLLLDNDPVIVLKTYEFMLLAAIHGDCQEIVAKIMRMSQPTQAVIQNVIQQYADAEGEAGSSAGAALSRSLTEAAAAVSRGLSVNTTREESFDGSRSSSAAAGAASSAAAAADLLQRDLQAARNELRKVKAALTESEAQRETLVDTLKETEKKSNEEKTKRLVLEKQLEARKDVMLKDFAEQAEESDRQIAKLKNDLENERRDKKKVEEKARLQAAELKDEIELLKQETRRVSVLEVQLQNYKNKLSELGTLREKISQLELQNKAYMDKLVEADAGSVGTAGLRKQIDLYKERVADAEARVSAVLAEKEAAENLRVQAEDQLHNIKQKLESKELEMVRLQALIEAKDFELENLTEKVRRLDSAAEKKEAAPAVEAQKRAVKGEENSEARISELQNELDDLRRVKERLEKAAAVHLAQIAVLEKEVAAGAGNAADAEKLRDCLQRIATQEEEIKRLRESKDDMAKEMMEALKKGSQTTLPGDEKLQTRIALLETQLEAEKKQASMREDIVKAHVEKEMDTLLTTLKNQLQIRERETVFYKKAVEENVDSTKKELKLLSSVLYEIGMRYHQLRAFCTQLKNENEAIKLRVKVTHNENELHTRDSRDEEEEEDGEAAEEVGP